MLKSGVSKIRNPLIARVLRELEYMEKWGTGYKRIIEDCDAGAKKEILENDGTKSALSRHQVQLLEFMKEPRSLKVMMSLLGWKDRTKFRNKFIKPLLDKGIIKMTQPEKPRSSAQKYVIAKSSFELFD